MVPEACYPRHPLAKASLSSPSPPLLDGVLSVDNLKLFLGGVGGCWSFKKLCCTEVLVYCALEVDPWARCFLHTSLMSSANQDSLDITKAEVLVPPPAVSTTYAALRKH